MSLKIIYEGPGFVAIHKPAGISVEAFADHDTVEARAWALFRRPRSPKRPFVGIVHRLDRPVSGLLLLARNKSTLRYLNEQFASRRVHKVYRARTQVPLPAPAATLEHHLSRDATGKKAVASDQAHRDSKPGRLRYELYRQDEAWSDYRIYPISGRFHQIRAQLAAAGSPIVGDGTYGSPLPYHENAIALHAESLSFVTKEGDAVDLHLPPDF